MSRLTPAIISISVIERTAARLTAALRQKLCQALLSAKTRCRQSLMVSPGPVVSGDLAIFDQNHPPAKQVHDLTLKHNNIHFTRWRSVEVPLQGENGDDLKTALEALDRVEAKIVKAQREAARPKPHKFELTPNSEGIFHGK